MKIFLLIFTIIFSATGFSASSSFKVKCWAPGKTQDRDSAIFKFKNGQLTYWDKNHISNPEAQSIFGMFSENLEEGAVETVRFKKGKNNYQMVTAITTADAITVGISPDFKKGFYKYEDLGSGNGNDLIKLLCAVL